MGVNNYFLAFLEMEDMKTSMVIRRLSALAIIATAVAATGCVLVIDGDGSPPRVSTVEWSDTGEGTVQAARSREEDVLAREVESRLRADSALADADLTVSASGQVVSLHGRVGEMLLLENALRIAGETPGVQKVVSRVTVEMEVN